MMRIWTIGMCLVAAMWVSCQSDLPVGTNMIVNPATASSDDVEIVQRPVLAFEDTVFSFGTVSEGHVVTHTFSFENQGPGVALIASVSSTCGCTVPKTWPREPLSPSETGTIDVTFDTHGKTGAQDKVVSVVANTTPGIVRLHLVGEVISPGSR